MSINVTVKGNPVSIRRGKMVTVDPDHARKEFQKRRCMRLEQVRQQSKEIAQDVRDKVRKEKSKQLTNIEQEGATKLKEWQNRKLLQLQNQYEECLKDIGLGHCQAISEENEQERVNVDNQIKKQLARERGQRAAALLQIQKNEKSLKKAIPEQQKKIARAIENTRSAEVSKLHKSRKKSKKRKTKISHGDNVNVTIDSSDSDVPMLNLESEDEAIDNEESCMVQSIRSNRTRSPASTSFCPSSNVPMPIPEPPEQEQFCYDHRISNHIKQRIFSKKVRRETQPPKLDSSNFVTCDIGPSAKPRRKSSEPQPTQQINTYERRTSISKVRNSFDGASRVNFENDFVDCIPCKKDELPYKPTISLKDARSREKSQKTSDHKVEKVVYYDHPNRYTKSCATERNVERITADSIEVCPDRNDFAEYMANAYKRDKEAERRGQIALEKEKIARDYEKMLRELPVLQKQERIASIKSHDPTLHLSDNRLREQNQIKQNRMENEYNKRTALPIPPLITIPPVSYAVTNPINVQDIRPECPCVSPELNLGTWDVIETAAPADKTSEEQAQLNVEDLQTMLDKLKLQREKIMREIGVLPKCSKLYKLINELEGLNDVDGFVEEANTKKPSEKWSDKKRSRSRSKNKKKSRGDASVQTTKDPDTSSSGTAPARKKSKSKPKVSSLQNICTQTSPRTIPKLDKSTKTDSIIEPAKPVINIPDETKTKNLPLCLCKEKDLKRKDSENICEIVIKISDDNEPQVTVSPKKDDVIIETNTIIVDHKSNKQSRNNTKITPKLKPAIKSLNDAIIDSNNSSSTSYYSLPTFNTIQSCRYSKSVNQTQPDKSIQLQTPLNKCSNILQKKPQQRNVNGPSLATTEGSRKNLDPRLIVYIKKLLAMSRQSIDNLEISTPSDVSTPNQTILNNYINNPLEQLQTLMRFYSLSSEDIEYYANSDLKTPTSTSQLNKKTVTTDAIANNSARQSFINIKPTTTDECDYNFDKAKGNETASTQYKSIFKNDSLNMSLYDYATINYPDIMTKYSEIADNCHRRISNLTALIEKVRQEKQEILKNPNNSSSSDKENSTSYLNLPTKFVYETDPKSSSSSPITSEGDLTKKVLEIDHSLAERLKNMSPSELSKLHKELATLSSPDEQPHNQTDELQRRLDRLVGKKGCNYKQSNIVVPAFVPLLLDIKELPKLPQQSNKPSYNVDLIKSTKRPPPIKSFGAFKQLHENADRPHQLSTIIEADSQISTKIKERTSIGSDSSLQSSTNTKPTHVTKTKSQETICSLGSTPVNVILPSQKSTHNSSDSSTEKSDFASMEAMLKSMGMGWAVATLRKTQEALAQSSSTSSLDINVSQKEIQVTDGSSSEVSLRSFLEKQLIQRLSTSKDSSNVDVTHFMRAFEEVSISHSSGENKNQRTSTPIQTTRSTEKSKTASVKFTGESDISSVKSITDVNFISLAESSKKSNISDE